MSSSPAAHVHPHCELGNKVRILASGPAANIEGIVAGVDTFGTVVLSGAKTTIIPLSAEEKAKLRQERRDRGGDADDVSDADAGAAGGKDGGADGAAPRLTLVLASRIQKVELLEAFVEPGVHANTVHADLLPRKRLFVTDFNTLLGRTVCERFGGIASHDWDIAGTRCTSSYHGSGKDDGFFPPQLATQVASYREDPIEFKKAVLLADVIVCPLRDDIHDAQAALRILSNTLFDTEKTFVLVSSVLTWAETDRAIKAKAAADAKAEREAARRERIEAGEDPDDDEDEDEENGNNKGDAADEEEEQEPPPVFGDSNDHERVPHPRYQHWRLLEQATKFANSESLHTYVLTAGMLYGNGEEALADLFAAAWQREPLPVVVAPGANVVPTVHVRDLATAIYNCANAEEVHGNRYMLAVDGGNNTTQEMIAALCKTMGDPNDAPVLANGGKPLGAASRWFDLLSVDLRLEASAFASLLGDDEWVAQDGLVAAMGKVAAEFRTVRALTPVRVAVVGPPESGKSMLAGWIAATYGLEHITVPAIIAYYTKHRQQVYRKLLAHREKRREAARRRQAEEDAANAADDGDADDRASAVSGGGGSNDSGRGSPANAAAAAAAAAAARRSKVGDDDDDEELSDDGWEVDFEVATPPTVRAGNKPGDTGSDVGTDDGGGSRPTSSRGGRDSGRGAGDDDNNDGGDNDGDGDERNKAPIAPEVAAAEDKEEDEDDDEELLQLKEELRLCNRVVALKNPADGRYIDHAIAVMARYKLTNAAQAKNQGYVLDGFPKSTRQAAFTFAADPDVAASLPEFDDEGKLPEDVLLPVDPADDSGEQAALLEGVDPALMFEHAIVLDASDSVTVSRASDFGSNSAERLQRLYRRLAFHQSTNARGGRPGVSVQSWLRAILTSADNAPARSVAVLSIDTDVAWPVTGPAAVAQVRGFLGPTHVVHPTVQELQDEEEAARVAAEKAARDAAELEAREKKRRALEEAERQAVAATNQRRLLTCTDEEKAAAAVCSIPAQQYLTDFIAAPLASCVASVARVRPADPLTVLSDALYQYDAPIVHAKSILTLKGGLAAAKKQQQQQRRSASSSNNTPTGTPRRGGAE